MATEAAARRQVSFAIVAAECISCAVCADVCPPAALLMDTTDTLPTWLESECTGCGICQRQCPTEAITVNVARRS